VISAVGLAIRLVYIIHFRAPLKLGGDPLFYNYGANLLVDGKGFIAPFQYFISHETRRVQAAEHPPLYILYLASESLFGLRTAPEHMVWSSFLGTASIVVTGLLGRKVAGPRAGLIAAFFAAAYPNIWVYDGQLLSETLAIFLITLTLLFAYRAWEKPTTGRIVAFGVGCGLAALSRSELFLLIPTLLIPVVWLAGGRPDARTALKRCAVGSAVAVLLMLPWVAYNMTRFKHPVYLSSQLDATLAGANCQDTYYGPQVGGLTSTCVVIPGVDAYADQSVNAAIYRKEAREFIKGHLSRLPYVVAVRVGRVTGLFKPSGQVTLDTILEGRERPLAWSGLLSAYVLEALAIGGVVVMVRRPKPRVPVFPLLVAPALVIVTVAATYGTDRFRATAETSIVVLAAVACDAAWRRLTRRSLDCVPTPGGG
jgi:4-amino-4-deoxy-L-arabinose transferase-like glycosyltransferase